MSEYSPVDHGYVVFGDDSGHQSEDTMSAEFAENEEALQNYIRDHLIKTNSIMHFLVKFSMVQIRNIHTLRAAQQAAEKLGMRDNIW